MKQSKTALLGLILLACLTLGVDHSQQLTDYIETDYKPENIVSNQTPSDQKIDDWQYNPKITTRGRRVQKKDDSGLLPRYGSGFLYGHTYKYLAGPATANPISAIVLLIQGGLSSNAQYSIQSSSKQDLGLSTGGAQDVNNFRENIENNYLPLNKDISYEGLFQEYYFDTGQKHECQKIFCPSYSKAVTQDPLSNETEHYTTIGLNSNLNKEDFDRKKLNLVVVLDISGSMGSSFDRYYYDRYGNRKHVEDYTEKEKIEIAKESLKGMTKHLKEGDRFGVVLFNNKGHKAKPLNPVEKTDMTAIKGHITNISEGGGTNMEAGIRKASEMLQEYKNVNKTEYENRVIFMTDAMPNRGTTSDSGLTSIAEENSQDGIYTSFVGIGVDFNSELVDSITSIKGANYFSVHSSKQFKNQMDKNFEYMVTPLVYNLKVELNTDSYDIKKVYGSSAAEESTDEVLKVNTLFPSPKKDGETKGGIVLAQLEKKENAEDIQIQVEYEKRNGKEETVTENVDFRKKSPEYFENSGIRKAVLLTRYADLMKNWISYERKNLDKEPVKELPPRYREPGIEPYPITPVLGEQERTSDPLHISDRYEKRIKRFKNYFETEKESIDDQSLDQEIEMMEKILQN